MGTSVKKETLSGMKWTAIETFSLDGINFVLGLLLVGEGMVPHAHLGEVAAESLIVADVLCTTHAEVIGDIADEDGVVCSRGGETFRLMTRFSIVNCH